MRLSSPQLRKCRHHACMLKVVCERFVYKPAEHPLIHHDTSREHVYKPGTRYIGVFVCWVVVHAQYLSEDKRWIISAKSFAFPRLPFWVGDVHWVDLVVNVRQALVE